MLDELQTWVTYIGSAAVVAFGAAWVDSPRSAVAHHFVEQFIANRSCLVDEGSGAFVVGADGLPVCDMAPAACAAAGSSTRPGHAGGLPLAPGSRYRVAALSARASACGTGATRSGS